MNQHMVPGSIFRGPRPCNRVVPLLRRLESWIDIYDDAAIAKELVMNKITDGKLGVANTRHSVHTFIATLRLVESPAGFSSMLSHQDLLPGSGEQAINPSTTTSHTRLVLNTG